MNGINRIALALTPIFALSAAFAQTIESSDDAIDEIVVTSQKIQRSLQETKESVAIVDAEAIDALRLYDLRDIFNQTANAYEIGNGENFGIRGITQSSASTGGGSGEMGSLYLDGVAFTGFSTRFGPKGMWDVQQVEILRGPQSTNVGRNALIGAVVVTTNSPQIGEFDSKIRLEAGNDSTYGFEGMVNFPVSENSALRLTAETWETDGFNTNPSQGNDDYDSRDNDTFRAKYRIEPTELLSIGFMAQYAETSRGQDIYRADLVDLESRESSANLQAFEDYEAFSASIDIDYQINETLAFRSITSMIDGEYDRFDDDDEGPEGGNAFRGRYAEDDNIAQELRLSYDSDNLTGVVGLYYTEVDLLNDTSGLVNIAPAILGVPDQLLPFYPANLEVDVYSPAEQETTNTAFFTEWDWKFADAWHLSLGYRYDDEDQDFISNTSNTLAAGSTLPDPVEAGQIAEMLQPGSGAFVEAGIAQVNALLMGFLMPSDNDWESTNYSASLPSIGLTYDFSDEVSLSAFYKRGYRSGGVDISLAAVRSEYDKEYLDNYELSLRSVLLDGAMTLNANAYYGDWTDQQVAICPMGPLSCFTQNAGESEIYGAEVDMRYNLGDQGYVFASAGYASTEFTSFISDTQGDLTGNEFALSPELTAAVGGQYWMTDNIAIGGSVNYQDELWADTQNTTRLDDRTLLDLNVRYATERYTILAYGKNVTDEFYLTTDAPGIDGVSRIVRAGAPRTYGVLLTIDF